MKCWPPVEKPLKKTALTAGAYCTSTCDLPVGGNHGYFSCLQRIWWFAKKIVVTHGDFHKLKNAKFDLFRACYHAGFPAWRQTAREYRKLPGGFFCRFWSKRSCPSRCRGPPRKSEPHHIQIFGGKWWTYPSGIIFFWKNFLLFQNFHKSFVS